ncbi:hypothetical protein GBAR_LOCUS19881 [Geodia barretti]|uniref:Uncharacterized protein n=1 Tax=Geodia barretti TaxID=519541 RepID=A0AA35SSM6_GEOBA|nr:hypothetical protein GBAR_LOCUS19881 [Geodia barretti]
MNSSSMDAYTLCHNSMQPLYVLLSAVCVDIVKPATGSKKKKRRKRTGSEDDKNEQQQHPSLEDVAKYLEDLSSLLREVSRPFRPFPSVERQLVNLEEELRRCQLPFDDKNVRGKERSRGTDLIADPKPTQSHTDATRMLANFEWSMYPQTCKLILQSYNMSMEDSQDVLDSKLTFLDSLLQRLDHHRAQTASTVKGNSA